MIIESFYLSNNVSRLQQLTDLSVDEIEAIVGRFKKSHWRFAGLLRGEVVLYSSGKLIIRHHFNKTKLYEDYCEIEY